MDEFNEPMAVRRELPLDLLFVVTGLATGGAEVQVTELAIAHSRAGWRVAVMSMVPNGAELRDRLAHAGVEVVDLGMRRGRPGPAGFLRAVQYVRRRRPRIVHSHMFHSNLLARLVRLVAPMPILVCTAHNSNEGGILRMLAYRITHGLGDVMTNVSHAAARELERRGAAPRRSISAIWNGIDVSRFRKDDSRRRRTREALALREEQFVFLAAGRLTPQKDYMTLLDAMRLVVNAESSVRLMVAGTGELADALARRAESLGLATHVLWLGARSDVECLMNASDAFVISSSYEGFGLVVAEAMASEVPVVATMANGPEEVLGGTGELVPVGAPELLAAAMLRAIRMSPDERRNRGLQGRARILENFSLAAATEAWRELYASLEARRV